MLSKLQSITVTKMEFSLKLFGVLLFVLVLGMAQTKPLEEPDVNSDSALTSGDEMMETAESQNPFLPRFAMKRLKERRQQAHAQRRVYQAQRRTYPEYRPKCTTREPIYKRYYYVSTHLLVFTFVPFNFDFKKIKDCNI